MKHFLGALLVSALPAMVYAQAASSGQQTIGGVTQPVRMQYAQRANFPQPGSVLEVPIRPGQPVKKGQLLVRQDDRLELVKLKAAELEANSTAKVDEAHANLEVKKSVLERKEATYKNHALSAQEYEEAKLDVIDAEARLKISELDQAKAKAEAEGERVKIDQMRLIAPFDGIVEAVDISVGEVSDPQKPVCSIVQVNPLWVEITNMPAAWAQRLKIGDKLEVRYEEQYAGTPAFNQQWVSAAVVFRAPLAERMSDTQLVRLEMPNPQNVDAGLKVVVKLPVSVTGPVNAVGTAQP